MKQLLAPAAAAVLGAVAIMAVQQLTAPRLAEQRHALETQLRSALPGIAFDNVLHGDCVNAPQRIYRARHQGRVVALVVPVTAPDGYRGPIELQLGLRSDGTLLAVQILHHEETPGLGGQIDASASDWLTQFTGKRFEPRPQWQLKTDGGAFDAITGASITPRAVLRAVARTLETLKVQQSAIHAARNACENAP